MNTILKQNRLFFLVLALLFLDGTRAAPALAVQSHGGAEGLVSHQIGHLLYITGMAYLLFRIFHLGLTGPGWQKFRYFLWTIILWNCVTLSSHWLNEYMEPWKYIKENGHTLGFTITNVSDAAFYLSLLDHLFLVPALLFLLTALKKWRHQT